MACQYGVQVDGFTVCFDVIIDPIVNDIVNPLEDFFSTLGNNIISTLSSAIQGIVGTLETALTDVGNFVVSSVQTFIQDLESLGSQIYNFLTGTVLPDLQQGVTTIFNALSSAAGDIEQFFSSAYNDLKGALNTVGNALAQLGNTLVNDLASVGNLVETAFSTVVNTVEQGFNSFVSGLENIGNFILNGLQSIFGDIANALLSSLGDLVKGFTEIGSVVENGLKVLGNDLYDALKLIVNDLLSGLGDLVKAFESGLNNTINQFMNFIKPRGRNEIQDVISEALSISALASAVYIGGAVGSKVVENLHPLHSLHLQELFDKITELFAVHRIPEEIVAGFFNFGIFKQFEYALNYLLRPRLTDLATETRAVWYGLETTSDLEQGLALEGYPSDLAQKYVGTIYRPLQPFILRYLMETGLSTQDFLVKQLSMEGFDPQDIPFIAKVFDALELVPFQNQIKSVIYQYYKVGLMSDSEATQIMDVFQIPKVQQQWILQTAKTDFELEQKQLLGQLALDLLAKAELTVEQTIEALTRIGYSESRAKLLANTRAVTQAPPPPKSTRALILQQALQNLSELGFG